MGQEYGQMMEVRPAGAAPATAPDEAPADPFGGSGLLLLIVVWVAFFYLFLIRPQKRREKERRELVDSVRKGDRVTTAGGIRGVVREVKKDDTVRVLVDKKSGTILEFSRQAISDIQRDEDAAGGEEEDSSEEDF